MRHELGDDVDLVLDGGPCAVGIESTVLDLTRGVPAILRPGAVTREQIEAIVGPVEMKHATVAHTVVSASPGQHAVHYAPNTPAFRFETSQRGLILVEGAVPGVAGGWIFVRDAVKRKLPKDAPMPGAFRSGADEAAPARSPAEQTQGENA